MIELTFTQYKEVLEQQNPLKIPTEHVYEDLDFFVLLFRTKEWEYFTIIKKEEILEFANQSEEAISDFKMNYCSLCLPIKDGPFWLPSMVAILAEPTYIETEYTRKIAEEIVTNEDIVEESETYEDFLVRLFDTFEKKVLTAVSTIEKRYQSQKNFGEFLSNLFNTVNTVTFATKVKKFLKQPLDEGRESAQEELKVDIPYNEAYEKALEVLYQEQINGYTINGKKWFGIKGVTKEIQQRVIQTVQEGIRSNKTTKEIQADVKGTFAGFTDWRSQNIARTETNRIINEGLVVGYKESGIEGGKSFSAALDNRTSEICERLQRKYAGKSIGLDEPFIDNEGTGATFKSFDTPPCHPNCRSRITFKPD